MILNCSQIYKKYIYQNCNSSKKDKKTFIFHPFLKMGTKKYHFAFFTT